MDWLRFRGALVIALVAATPSVAIAGASTIGSVAASPAPQGDLPKELEARLREALDHTMATYHVPGAAVGVWVPGKGTWIGTAGLADLKTDARDQGHDLAASEHHQIFHRDVDSRAGR